jgi:hypothetical protein
MDKWELWFDLKKAPDICVVSKAFILAVGPMPPSQNSVTLSPGVYQPEHETYGIPPSSTEVKNEWSYYSTPPICLYGMHSDNFPSNDNRALGLAVHGLLSSFWILFIGLINITHQ